MNLYIRKHTIFQVYKCYEIASKMLSFICLMQISIHKNSTTLSMLSIFQAKLEIEKERFCMPSSMVDYFVKKKKISVV